MFSPISSYSQHNLFSCLNASPCRIFWAALPAPWKDWDILWGWENLCLVSRLTIQQYDLQRQSFALTSPTQVILGPKQVFSSSVSQGIKIFPSQIVDSQKQETNKIQLHLKIVLKVCNSQNLRVARGVPELKMASDWTIHHITQLQFHNVICMDIQKNTLPGRTWKNSENRFECDELDSLRLSEVFEEAKYLINSISKAPPLAEKSDYTKNRLRLITEFVVRKFKAKAPMDVKKFVGLLSLFSFLLTAAQNQQNSLNFPINFYRNLHKYAQAISTYWNQKKQQQNQGQKRKILSTFLFSLTTFCENSPKLKGLDVKKIFSLGLMRCLLKLKLYDQERIMRYYRILLVYMHENKPRNLSSSLFLQSLVHHCLNCSSNANTEGAIIFLLNRLLKNRKMGQELAERYETKTLAGKVKEFVFRDLPSPQVRKLGFSLLAKLVELDTRVCSNLLTADDFIFIINSFYLQSHATLKVNSTLFALLAGMPPSSCFEVYRHLVGASRPTLIGLEILQFLTRKQNPSILLDIVSCGFLDWLLGCPESSPTLPAYQESIKSRIVDNIISRSGPLNRDISQVLKSLALLRGHDVMVTDLTEFSFF